MEEAEYKDSEKVLFKTRGKLTLPGKEPEEADYFITKGHVVIETEEPIKIPFLEGNLTLRLQACNAADLFI